MSKSHTHYDNLYVTRNASDSVIRAAYKTLCQKYHPDKFDGSPARAERIMKIVNMAYYVLSDPNRKTAYDESLKIAEDELRSAEVSEKRNSEQKKQQRSRDQWSHTQPSQRDINQAKARFFHDSESAPQRASNAMPGTRPEPEMTRSAIRRTRMIAAVFGLGIFFASFGAFVGDGPKSPPAILIADGAIHFGMASICMFVVFLLVALACGKAWINCSLKLAEMSGSIVTKGDCLKTIALWVSAIAVIPLILVIIR